MTVEEIRNNQRPLLSIADENRIVRYEVDVDPDRQAIVGILLVLRSSRGEVRRLRFENLTIPELGPLQVPLGLFAGPIYLVDTSFKGWERAHRIEVGLLAEDQPTFFFAEDVTLVD